MEDLVENVVFCAAWLSHVADFWLKSPPALIFVPTSVISPVALRVRLPPEVMELTIAVVDPLVEPDVVLVPTRPTPAFASASAFALALPVVPAAPAFAPASAHAPPELGAHESLAAQKS